MRVSHLLGAYSSELTFLFWNTHEKPQEYIYLRRGNLVKHFLYKESFKVF